MRKFQLSILFVVGVLAGLLCAYYGLDGKFALAAGTDRSGEYILTSGPVDGDIGATYFLDSTTGTLTATILSNLSNRPSFQAMYQGNVTMDLNRYIAFKKVDGNGQPLAVPAQPNYLLTTATIDMRRAGNKLRPAYAPLYVVETTTGIMMVYIIPFDSTKHSQNSLERAALTCFYAEQINVVNKREE